MLAVVLMPQPIVSLVLFAAQVFIFVNCRLKLFINIRYELDGIVRVTLHRLGAFLSTVDVSCCRTEQIDFSDDPEDLEALVASRKLQDGQAEQSLEVLEPKVQLQIQLQVPVFHLAHEQNCVSLVIPFL